MSQFGEWHVAHHHDVSLAIIMRRMRSLCGRVGALCGVPVGAVPMRFGRDCQSELPPRPPMPCIAWRSMSGSDANACEFCTTAC